MARFTAPTISGYNASPPADDGSEVASNQVTWAKHKTKLADPIKEYADAVISAVTAMDGRIDPSGIVTTATNLTLTAAAHNGKLVIVTGASTITLPESASASTSFAVRVKKNEAANTVTIDTDGSETVDGASSITLTENGEIVRLVTDGSNWFTASRNIPTNPLPLDYLSGFDITLNGSDTDHDIDIASGVARDSSDSVNIELSSAMTKQINANWAEGTNQGGFPSGLTLSNDTAYRIFAIAKDDGTVDVGFDTSATAANLLSDASDYSFYVQIGNFETDGSANISWLGQHPGGTAAKEEMEDETSDKFPDAAIMKHHPGVAKFWVKFAGSNGSIAASYNVTSVTRNSAGDYTVTIDTDFASADWVPLFMGHALSSGLEAPAWYVVSIAAGSVRIRTQNNSGTNSDLDHCYVAGFGTQ